MRAIVVDVGNTSVDWALWDGGEFHGHGKLNVGGDLSELSKASGGVRNAVACNVSTERAKEQVTKALEDCSLGWITSVREAAEVTNQYDPPESLGADRFCALLGLRAEHGSGVAVLAGTAMTVDPLSEEGEFRGGLIVPSVEGMLAGIEKTTQIGPVAPSRASKTPAPSNTASAVTAGAMHAVAGAVISYLRSEELEGEKVVVAGGYAEVLSPMVPGSVVDRDLVFRGLVAAAGI